MGKEFCSESKNKFAGGLRGAAHRRICILRLGATTVQNGKLAIYRVANVR